MDFIIDSNLKRVLLKSRQDKTSELQKHNSTKGGGEKIINN